MIDIYRDFIPELQDDEMMKDIESAFYTFSQNKKYMIDLQNAYGTTNVISLPELEFLTEKHYGDDRFIIVICDVKDVNYPNIINIMKHVHLTSRYKDTIYLEEKDAEYYFSSLPNKRSFIIASGIEISTCSLIVSSGIPFSLFNINKQYKLLMVSRHLKEYVSDNVEYEYFKQDFENAFNKRTHISNIVSKINKEVEEMYTYFPHLYRSKCNTELYKNEVQPIESDNISFFYEINHEDNLHNTIFYYDFIESQPYSEGGIFLDYEVCKSFLVSENVYYYPWVGILEIIDDQDIMYLINCEKFIISSKFCITLFVLTEDVKDIITSKLSIDVEVITLPVMKRKSMDNVDFFDMNYFKKRPSVVNVGNIINKTRLQIFNNKSNRVMSRIQGNQNPITEKTFLNSVTVVSSLYPYPMGIFYDCICLNKPIVIKKTDYFKDILGDEYPLFIDRSDKFTILSLLTEENIILAHNIISNIEREQTNIIEIVADKLGNNDAHST